MKKSLVWNCMGDSITSPFYVENHYYDCIVQRNPEWNLSLNNYGVCGTTIAGEDEGAFCQRYVEMQDADIITVFGGINDWGRMGGTGPTPLGAIEDKSASTFYGALNILCQGLKKKYPKALIVFMTPIGSLGYAGTSGYAQETNRFGLGIRAYVDAMQEICLKYDFPCVDLHRNCGFTPENPEQNKIYFLDGLHLTEKGHLRVSYLLEDMLREGVCSPT